MANKRISGEGKIGILLGRIDVGGPGAMMVFPEQLWIGWSYSDRRSLW